MSDFDVVIAGGGVNALACAATLARWNLSVCVVERNANVGGGAITEEVTLPGFKHDLYGSSHVWIQCNEDFKAIQPDLERYGLKYIEPKDHITGHPDRNGGPGIVIHKDIDRTCDSIAAYSRADAARYRRVYEDFEQVREGFVKAFFSPPAPPSALPRALETNEPGLRRLREFSMSARAWVETNFENDFIKAVMLNWALAPQILPDQEGAGQSFYIMIPAIHYYGQAIPEGGSMELPKAMARYVEAHGGKVLTNASVSEIIVENGRAAGLRLEDGRTVRGRRATVSALDPKQTFLRLLGEDRLNPDFAAMVKGYSFGKISICRAQLALAEEPRFLNGEAMSAAPFHRIVDSMEQMTRFYAEIAMGIPPSDPFLWSACWTKLDPSRAPEGKHTLIFDTYVSNWLADGRTWNDIAEDYYAKTLLPKLQQYAPNIAGDVILGKYLQHRGTLETANLSFVEGTTNGGERIAAQLGSFRPFPGYAHYRAPVRDLYMTGPHCHPGGAISAMGTITARVMLDDMGIAPADFW
ncbi:FAD dependent oxidoreductase [Rhizorhabdus wittichii RW1]|uniref:Pyridine nucleotide-disulfide oxidoreductase domain-containing protein 2 n=1 Tax=Rhizorhabdus wittichii (strain DSM 6014 / CCUG 31198 / JCM 15750 / NBRC 105917 / EY 4224 / RW1) TaxID=392499 RepID=A0A9J9LDF1_RHIWR|nr:FAD dependent oxidoreductase [Rhizorhabdus wittichii RW1]